MEAFGADRDGARSKFVSVESRGGAELNSLQSAIKDGDLNRVSSLIEDGADVNQVMISSDGNVCTALMTALAVPDPVRRIATVKMLLDAGASPNVVLCRGRNIALRYLVTHSQTEECLAELISMLVAAGARPDPDLVDIADSRSFFSVTYLLRLPNASSRPVEQTFGSGCCLIPTIVMSIILGIAAYLLWQYKVWPFDVATPF